MITRVLRLISAQQFGQVENPLWQVALIEDSDHLENENAKTRSWSGSLIPFKNFKAKKNDDLPPNLSFVFQSFVSLENLRDPQILENLRKGRPVQFWIDRVLSSQESDELQFLLNNFNSRIYNQAGGINN